MPCQAQRLGVERRGSTNVPERGATTWSGGLAHVLVNVAGARISADCTLRSTRELDIARWPALAYPWLARDMRERASLPPLAKGSVDDGLEASQSIRIEGIADNAAIARAPNSDEPATVRLRVLGANGDVLWLVNGRLKGETRAAQAFEHAFAETGDQTITRLPRAVPTRSCRFAYCDKHATIGSMRHTAARSYAANDHPVPFCDRIRMAAKIASAASQSRDWVPASLAELRHDWFFVALLCVLAALTAFGPAKVPSYPRLVDWPTITALTGLLVLTKGVEMSGVLHRSAHWLLDRMATERATALCLVLLTAILSMLLTNDVALFAVVPLTLGICRIATIPSTRLIVFEALAVNAGSTLTPIGNPQNLFLWQQSGLSFVHFMLQMLPLVAAMLALLVFLTWFAFPARAIHLEAESKASAPDWRLLSVALVLYVPFLVAADLHHATWALAAVVLVFGVWHRRVLQATDWGLLVVFVLMFIDLRLLAALDIVHGSIAALGLDQPPHVFWAGIGASQLISNVPATIALAECSHDWRAIAYGVNVGGFGILTGSLANLIALRMAPEPRKYRVFHAWSLPFLLAAALIGYVLL